MQKTFKNILRTHLPYIFFITTLIIAFFLFTIRDIFHNVYNTPDLLLSDLVHVNLSEKYLLFKYLQQNKIPVITNLSASGYPILAESQIGALSPINIFLYKFLPFVFAFNATYILSFLILGLSTYFLYYDFVKSKILSLLGSISLTFSAATLLQVPHQGIIQNISLVPLIFLMFIRAVRSKSVFRWVVVGFLLSQQFLFGHFQFHVYTLLFIFILYTSYLLSNKIKLKLRPIIPGIFIYLLIALPQLINSFQFMFFSNRQMDSYVSFSTPPLELIKTFIHPFVNGTLLNGELFNNFGFSGPIFYELNFYLGILPIILTACLFLLFRNKQKIHLNYKHKTALVCLLVSLIFIYGMKSPFKILLSLPVISNSRNPHRIVFFFNLFLIIIIISLFNKLLKNKHKSVIIVSLITIQILLTIGPFSNYHTVTNFDDIKKYASLSAITLNSKAYYTHGSGNKWFKYLNDNSSYKTQSLYSFLEPNLNFLSNTPSCGLFKYSNFHPKNFYNLTIFLNSRLDPKSEYNDINLSIKLLGLLGCDHLITFGNDKLINNNLVLQYKKNTFSQYKILKSIPSLMFTNTYNSYIDIYHYLDQINNSLNDKDRIYIKGGDIITSNKKPVAKIVVEKNGDQRTVINIKNNTSGYLYIHKLNYPNWKAYVNGNQTEIREANGAFMAVKLNPGTNTVELMYQPPFWYLSLALMIFGYIAVITLIFYKLLANTKNQTYL